MIRNYWWLPGENWPRRFTIFFIVTPVGKHRYASLNFCFEEQINHLNPSTIFIFMLDGVVKFTSPMHWSLAKYQRWRAKQHYMSWTNYHVGKSSDGNILRKSPRTKTTYLSTTHLCMSTVMTALPRKRPVTSTLPFISPPKENNPIWNLRGRYFILPPDRTSHCWS